MLSHCIPQAEGSVERSAAWETLRLAVTRHQVYLMCCGDGAVHLSHWRQLKAMTQRLAIEPLGPCAQLIYRWMALHDAQKAQRFRTRRALGPLLQQWSGEVRFTNLITTMPQLEQVAHAVLPHLPLMMPIALPPDGVDPTQGVLRNDVLAALRQPGPSRLAA
ncbi:MAG: hypothetical protein WD042_00120 [Phycisphaeraceae bacterium]